jgi:sarcosine oxidase, subunit gamma
MGSQLLDRCALIRVQSLSPLRTVPDEIRDYLRTEWPEAVGTVASGRVVVISLGPTEWLVQASSDDGKLLLKLLADAFVGSQCVATDVSSALSRIRLSGRNARELLSKGCSIDVHVDALKPGTAPRTRFAGMPVVVHCLDNLTFELIVALSFRDYLLSWLRDAELEFSESAS